LAPPHYFNWSFVFGFLYIKTVIVIKPILKLAKPRITALPLSLLLS
jgi:hypothetical protein